MVIEFLAILLFSTKYKLRNINTASTASAASAASAANAASAASAASWRQKMENDLP